MNKLLQLTLSFFFTCCLSAYAQWMPVSSGTTNNVNGIYLLDSGVAFAVGDAGTLLNGDGVVNG